MSSSVKHDSYRRVEFRFPFLIIRTKYFLKTFDRLGKWSSMKALGPILLYFLPICAAIGLFFVFTSIFTLLVNDTSREIVRSMGLLANIGIPGLNPYLPVFYGWIALLIGMIVHEAAHGIVARTVGIPVKFSGFYLLLGIPIAAFVDLEEEALKSSKTGITTRILAAGPSTNMLVGIASLLCLILFVNSLAPVTSGIGIVSELVDYPAYNVGIRPGDVITAINNMSTPSNEIFTEIISSLEPGEWVSLQVYRNGFVKHYSLQLAPSPENVSRGFIGIGSIDFALVLGTFQELKLTSLLAYLIIPTLPAFQYGIPYSHVMHRFYTSPVGEAFYPIANFFFWIWLLNFSLAIFNSLPIYPFDGGQVLNYIIRSRLTGPENEKWIKRITMSVTLAMVALFLLMILLPYLTGT